MAFDALQALQAFGAGRQMAIQDRQQRRTDQLRTDLAGAYDPATGNIDATRARQAYVTAGDVPGAMEFDQHMTQQHGQLWTQNRDRIIAAVPFLEGVTDEATYQQALQTAHANGLDIQGAPPQFDPQWVQGIRTIGTRLREQARAPQAPTTMQRNADFIESRYGPTAADAYVSRQAAPPPILQHNADGTITITPQAGAMLRRQDGQLPAQPPPVTRTPEQLRADAAEAIRQGADPAAVQAELARMLGGSTPANSVDARPPNDPAPAFHPQPGGAGPQAPQTFR